MGCSAFDLGSCSSRDIPRFGLPSNRVVVGLKSEKVARIFYRKSSRTHFLMSNIFWILLALVAGTMLPLQGALNTKLGHEGQSPFHASMISFIIGAISVALYVFLTRQNVSWTGLRGAPAYAWLGGILGAFYVTVIILAFPKLGPGLTFALVVAGQMIISMLLEHFDILVAQQNPITAVRLGGVALIIAGVILIKFF